jgi:hypothetical protein
MTFAGCFSVDILENYISFGKVVINIDAVGIIVPVFGGSFESAT